MSSRMMRVLFFLVAATPLAAQDASVTLFSDGRVLVRRAVAVSVPAGSSAKALALGVFDPGSLTSLDAGVSFSRVGYDPAFSEDALLRRSIGKSFQIARGPDTTRQFATLVGVDPERWSFSSVMENRIVFGRPGLIYWPTSSVPLTAQTDVQVESDRARTSLNVLYQTSGAAWSAQYRIFAGTTARIEGSALLSAGRLDMTNAEVQLLAGNIGAGPVPSPMPRIEMAMSKVANAFDGMAEEAVGEAHLYTLSNRVNFIPGTQSVVPLFAPTTARAERLFTLRGALQYYGGLGQDNEEQTIPVDVAWRLDRKLGTTFGDLPLPGGRVSVFETDRGGRAQLIGQGTIAHTAAGEVLLVRTGTAFDVTARRTQTEFTTVRAASNRTIATVGYSIALQNAKDSSVVVEVLEERGGEWSVLASSVPAQKRSTTRTAFMVTVPAKGSATLTYRLRVVW